MTTDFESDLLIDKDTLDFEWIRQASLNQKYSEIYASAILERDQKKDELAIRKAEIDLQIRVEWENWGFSKAPTETALINTIISQEDVQKLMKEVNELTYEVNRLGGVRGSFEHKKSALENLSRLYLSGYWGEAKIPSEAQDKYASHGKETHIENLSKSPRLTKKEKK